MCGEAESIGAVDDREHAGEGDVGPIRSVGELVADLVERLLDHEQAQKAGCLGKICGKAWTTPNRLSISLQEIGRHPSGAGLQPGHRLFIRANGTRDGRGSVLE